MIYYISDLHFGHENCIRFDGRPFETVEEMDQKLIENWKNKVAQSDDVYIVGDFCFRNQRPAEWYLDQLPGKKHLIIGNHDGKMLKRIDPSKYFESVSQIEDIQDNGRRIIMCHYPIAEWPGMNRGAYHIYGHIHSNTNDTYWFMRGKERALNAAACIVGYTPVLFNELVEYNRAFKKETGYVLEENYEP